MREFRIDPLAGLAEPLPHGFAEKVAGGEKEDRGAERCRGDDQRARDPAAEQETKRDRQNRAAWEAQAGSGHVDRKGKGERLEVVRVGESTKRRSMLLDRV